VHTGEPKPKLTTGNESRASGPNLNQSARPPRSKRLFDPKTADMEAVAFYDEQSKLFSGRM